ncbi:lachnocin family radical SAM-modified peptide [Clostridium weizhouense]|uniref:Lachnocin family radical SAM-modified peptide n=1 Tax=Clostridium weizhouense TaxID=2859781 RepID=A0ABS7ASQ5_9CLOT|nr:lachnocin family radical SAM-modified peptide [Clostridium weizhouense]
MNNKVSLKKINNANYSTVTTLGCHCGCPSKASQAYYYNYMGQYLNIL